MFQLIRVKKTMVSSGGNSSITTAHDLIVTDKILPEVEQMPYDPERSKDGTTETQRWIVSAFATRDEAIDALCVEGLAWCGERYFDEARVRHFGDCSLPC